MCGPKSSHCPEHPEWADPFAAAFAQPAFWPDKAFTQLQQISANMSRQMNAMIERAGAMQAAVNFGRYIASFANLLPGTLEYTQISTWNGNSMCTCTTQMSETGGKPQLVSNTSGDCGAEQPSLSTAQFSISTVAIRMTSAALSMTSAGRFWSWGPLRRV